MTRIWTIGYEGTTVRHFLDALTSAGVTRLIDVRAVARSRRPGFAKTRLSENLASVGIGYVHLPSIGTPADGRVAARAGRHEEMHRIFREHLQTPTAQDGLDQLRSLLSLHGPTCLLCFERDPRHCHRSLICAELAAEGPLEVTHLYADPDD